MKGSRIFCIVALCILVPLFIFILCLPKCVKPKEASAVLVDEGEVQYTNAFYGSTLSIYDYYFMSDYGTEYQNYFSQYPHTFLYSNNQLALGNSFNSFFTDSYNLSYYGLCGYPIDIPMDYDRTYNDFIINCRYRFAPLNHTSNAFLSFSWKNYPLGYEQFNMLMATKIGHGGTNIPNDQRYKISIELRSVDTNTLIGYYKTENWTIYDRLNRVFNIDSLNELYAEYPTTEDKQLAFELVDITINVYRYSNSGSYDVTFTSPIVTKDRVDIWNENSFAFNNIVTVEPSPLDIIFGSIDSFFAIELFPNFNIGLVFEIAMAVMIIGIGLKLFLGG